MLTFRPAAAYGEIAAPPSKSMAHRLLICSALARKESVVKNVDPSEDVLATLDCLSALGAQLSLHGDAVTVRGTDFQNLSEPLELPCRACGSTLRFLIPLALLTGKRAIFTGSATLFSRPLSVYETICARQGQVFRRSETSLEVAGRLKPGVYEIPGDISSQFVSGLLFALPLLEAGSELRLLPPVESLPYIDLTISALHGFGIKVLRVGSDRFYIPGNQAYHAHDTLVEGDWSNAAFLEALNLVGGKVTLKGLSRYSRQGDSVYRRHFEALQKGFATIDLTDCPDLGPILFALAAEKQGALFTGTRRLRLKESDRCAAMAEELHKLGAELVIEENGVWIGKNALCQPSEPLDSHDDHRIAMALSVLLSKYGGQLRGERAVDKSFPGFFEVLRGLGLWIEDCPEEETDGVDH